VSIQDPKVNRRRWAGFTLLELALILAVAAILAMIAIPSYQAYVVRAQNAVAIADIGQIEMLVSRYEPQNNGQLPPDLTAIGMSAKLDPWGNPYYYHTTFEGTGNGLGRKDKSLHPINTDYDLYSSGPDGKSVAALTAKSSQDDIIRANDGSYIGIAANY
jgi:general secretion pathway protein G